MSQNFASYLSTLAETDDLDSIRKDWAAKSNALKKKTEELERADKALKKMVARQRSIMEEQEKLQAEVGKLEQQLSRYYYGTAGAGSSNQHPLPPP